MEQINYKYAYENVMIANKMMAQEIERLQNIIKEIRTNIEDIKSNYFKRYDNEVYELCDDILDILDKENK